MNLSPQPTFLRPRIRPRAEGDACPDPVRQAVEDRETLNRLLHVVRRIAATPADAEDALQDAMVQALSHADRFRADARVSTWLHRIAVNAALMGRRRASTWSRRRVALGGERSGDAGDVDPAGKARATPGSAVSDPSPSAEQQLVAMEDRRRLRWAISRLPVRSRRTIESYLCEAPACDDPRGGDDAPGPELLGDGVSCVPVIDLPARVTTNASRARLSRARARLKGLLEGVDAGWSRAA